MTLGKNIRILRKKSGFSQEDVAQRLGYKSYTTIQKWESGVSEPSFAILTELANIFHVDMDTLTKAELTDAGETVPPSRPKGVRINVYGSVPAGIPIEAIEDIVDWEEIPAEWTKGGQEYIALRVVGDSMYPKYMEGDTIIIQLQPTAETGQDCVVYVNGFDATLKTVKFVPEGIQLVPINPSYSPRTYGKDDDSVKILGIVVEIRRKP